MTEVCVDASFALKLVLPEVHTDLVHAKWSEWRRSGVVCSGPWLLMFEAHSVLRRKVTRAELSEEEARDAWRILRRHGIRTVHPRGTFDSAWNLATKFGRPTTYDAVYMAVAELRGCELWTADSRLVNAVGGKLSWLRYVVPPL